MAPELVTCPLLLGVLAVIVTSFAFAEETSVTVNAESFLEVVTKKIAGLNSKVDLVLRTCGNEHNGQAVDPKTENQICSMSSRIIEMENEIDGLKASAAAPSSGGWPPSDRKVLDMISSLESKMEALQSSFELRISELEQRVQQLNDRASYVSVESEAELGSQTCNFKKAEEKNLVNYLLNFNSNIFLGKPSNASSLYDSGPHNQVANAVDGDFVSHYHSKQESDHWIFVDLEVSYFIWEIRVTIRDTSRTAGIKVYVSNNATFLDHGKIDVNSLQLFGYQVGNSLSKTLTFKKPHGMCGRYVVVNRAVQNEYLIIQEIQGTGYIFD